MRERAPALPSWVRACDALALMLVALAVSITITGGFRERTPWGLISFTSWIRPLALGVVLLLLRHGLHRQPWFGARVATSVKAVGASAESRAVWPVFLCTRAGVLSAGFFGIALLGYAPRTPPWRVYENDFLNMPARWDTGWYLGIAEHGYAWDPSQANGMQNIAFFPAYPMLIRYSSLFLAREYLFTGWLIALVAFFFALKYLFRLARSAIGDDGAATAVAMLAAYPFAFFYSTAYTESLYLLTVVAACYHFERNELWQAALWGMAAGLSRPNGCLLSIVLALMVLRDGRAPWRVVADRLSVAALPGIGMLIFSTYIYFLTGNPFEWAENHAAFGRVYRGVDALLLDRIRYIQAAGLYGYVKAEGLDVFNAIPIFFALGSVWPVYRRFGVPYAAMILVNVIPPVLMGGVLSMGRVTSTLFPIFLWLAAAVPPAHRTAWLILFGMLQALCAIVFFTWRPLV